jgi:hypothetical protein
MKRAPILYALWALFAPARGDSQGREAAQCGSADTSPLLIFIAIVLLLMLSILVTDLYRDELRALGLVGSEPGIASALMAP